MSKKEMSIDHSDRSDKDLESQQIVLLPDRKQSGGPKQSRNRWRYMYLLLQARNVFISVYSTNKTSAASDTPYSAILPCTRTLHPSGDPKQSRNRWRNMYMLLQARNVFISVYSTNKTSAASDTPYSAILTCTRTLHPNSGLTALESSAQVSINIPDEGNIQSQQENNIATIVKDRDMNSLHRLGGVRGIAKALHTNLEAGITGYEADLRSKCKLNILSKSQPPMLRFFGLLLKSCKSYIIVLLLISAVVSLGFGVNMEGPRKGWHEGVIIILVVIILVVVPSMRDFCFLYMHESKGKENLLEIDKTVVDVFRGGCHQQISSSEVVSGDIVCLKKGCQVPADGLFISGELQVVDVGSLDVDVGSGSINEQSPFLFNGTKVIKGNGRMLVTSIGVDTSWGKLMSTVTCAPNKSALGAQLDKASICTQIFGLIISILMIVVLFIRFKLLKGKHELGLPELKGKPIPLNELASSIHKIFMKPSGKLSNLTTSLAMLLVGIVEGLPFLIAIALRYWNKKTLHNNASSQKLSACVAMGSITTICIDKTGGLPLNSMEVKMCFIGEELISGDSMIAPDTLDILCHGIISPLLKSRNPCSLEEDPLLSWLECNMGMKNKTKEILQQSCIVLEKEVNSDANEDESGILMRKNGDNEITMSIHSKGDAKTILAMCSRYLDNTGKARLMNEDKMSVFNEKIEEMQSKNYKTIAFAYKQTGVSLLEESDLTFVGLLGLKPTDWIETKKTIQYCRNAGIDIKLISEDSVLVLTTIAEKCGMIKSDSNEEMKLEAEEFRGFTHDERMNKVGQVVVMGTSLPADRLLLVKYLKQKGHRVALVGVRTSETPALREADVGITMGTWGTKLARESSDIIIWNDDFDFLVSIISCGRCAYENIRKYIQFQLTMTIAWFIISPITTLSYGQSPITVVQWIWVSLIVTLFGGLALLTEPPEQELMNKPPVNPTDPLITKSMWINIVTQALYQATILVTLQHNGQSVMGISHKICKAMIFNSFVLCQVFNQFNSRELEKKNVFERLHQNNLFWVAIGVTLVLQEAFIEIASILVHSARLSGKQWGVCFLIGITSWPINFVTKCASSFITDWLNILTGMTQSASSEWTLNLELPPIKDE